MVCVPMTILIKKKQNSASGGVLSFCFEEIGVWPTNSYSVSIENGANCFGQTGCNCCVINVLGKFVCLY